LHNLEIPYSVIEIDPELVSDLRCKGTACIYGDASNTQVLSLVLNLTPPPSWGRRA
jgi:hypothetical protein